MLLPYPVPVPMSLLACTQQAVRRALSLQRRRRGCRYLPPELRAERASPRRARAYACTDTSASARAS